MNCAVGERRSHAGRKGAHLSEQGGSSSNGDNGQDDKLEEEDEPVQTEELAAGDVGVVGLNLVVVVPNESGNVGDVLATPAPMHSMSVCWRSVDFATPCGLATSTAQHHNHKCVCM